MMETRKLVLICAACVALGWFMAGTAGGPEPTRPENRPALRWIARIAKTFLWVALAAEKPPADEPPAQLVHTNRQTDGSETLQFREGW